MSSQFKLLQQRRFLPFFVSQFLGAFNDNLYKNALAVLLTFKAMHYSTWSAGVLVNLCAGIFILPYFLFSATSGQLADKYEKSKLIQFTKILEIVIMLVAAAGFIFDSLTIMMIALFLLGAQSAVFSPVKYAYLPQTLRESELIGGNALVESGTFIAILIGTLAGGLLIASYCGATWTAVTGVVVSILGYVTSLGIPKVAAAAPDLRINWNPLTSTWENIRYTTSNRAVFLSVLGISWFWFYGAVFLSQFPGFVKDVLHGNEHVVTLLLATFSIGIGIGSLLCERLSGKQIEIGLVPFGSIGLSVFAFDMWLGNMNIGPAPTQLFTLTEMLAKPQLWRVLFDLVAIGSFAGLFIVPLYAMMQTRCEPSGRSRIIAGNNIINAAFMVVAALMAVGLLEIGFSVPQIFLVIALLNIAIAAYIYTVLPEFTIRFMVWIAVHLFYRLKVRGMENVPDKGAALLICNHPSLVDALIIAAACRRPIRFVMDYNMYKVPVAHYIFRDNRAIPIATAREDMTTLRQAYADIDEALKAGELVGIFPEGHASYDGEIDKFQGGVSRILKQEPVPVIPMALRGLWGSFFSRIGGRAMSQPFRRGLFSRIELVVDTPIPPEQATPPVLFEKIVALRGDQK